MNRPRKLYNLLALLLLIALTALLSNGQTNQFAKEGLSFSYPADWVLSEQSDARMQSFSLTRGPNEAQIVIAALRSPLTPEQILEAQPVVTGALADSLQQSIVQSGARVERSLVGATIGGAQANGIRLRASGRGEPGNAEVYWVTLGGRLIHVVYIGSDQERLRAADLWNMLCSTLRVTAVQ